MLQAAGVVTAIGEFEAAFRHSDWLRGQTEHCLLATRGKPVVQLTNQSKLLSAPRGRHSEKLVEFYILVESLSPASRYLSLFHRGPSRPDWDAHGGEATTNLPYGSPTARTAERYPIDWKSVGISGAE
jgi:N6-adenosine-specific RNA methylase IME4